MFSNVSLYNRWLPVVDGKIIPDYPTKLLVEGKFTRIPVIVGYVPRPLVLLITPLLI